MEQLGVYGSVRLKNGEPIGGFDKRGSCDHPLSDKEREDFHKRRQKAYKEIKRVKAKMAMISSRQKE